eukprot:SAG11_NODE_5880_length_1442_cov_1.674609_1_plen_75_part_10
MYRSCVFKKKHLSGYGVPYSCSYERAMYARLVEGMTAAEAALWATQSEDAVDAAALVATEHEFVPLGFEAGGAFG